MAAKKSTRKQAGSSRSTTRKKSMAGYKMMPDITSKAFDNQGGRFGKTKGGK